MIRKLKKKNSFETEKNGGHNRRKCGKGEGKQIKIEHF